MYKMTVRIFLVFIFSGWSFAIHAVPLVAPGDFILGGISDGTNFVVGDVGLAGNTNNWPGGEAPSSLIDGVGQKYLNFAGPVSPTGAVITPSSGGSVANSITFWTANDAEDRDPASYELYGTNAAITAANPGDSILLSSFTLISSAPITLPSTRNAGGGAVLDTANSLTVPFANTTAYNSYLILFPTIKNSGTANSMQLAEVQLENIPPPPQIPTLSIWGLGLMSLLLALVARRRTR